MDENLGEVRADDNLDGVTKKNSGILDLYCNSTVRASKKKKWWQSQMTEGFSDFLHQNDGGRVCHISLW